METLPEWIQAYDEFLTNPHQLAVNPHIGTTLTGDARYALIDRGTSDHPELLVHLVGEEFGPVFQIGLARIGADLVPTPSTALAVGASEALGCEARLEASANNHGIYQVTCHNDEAFSTLFAQRESGSFVKASEASEWECDQLAHDHVRIEWFDQDDRSALYAGEPTISDANKPDLALNSPKQEPAMVGSNQLELTGEVLKLTADEVDRDVARIMFPDDLAEYYFLWLDRPHSFSGNGPGRSGSITADYLYLGGADVSPIETPRWDGLNLSRLEGHRARVIVHEADIFFNQHPGGPKDAPSVRRLTNFEYID